LLKAVTTFKVENALNLCSPWRKGKNCDAIAAAPVANPNIINKLGSFIFK